MVAEQEANYFTSNILAPRITIYHSGCRTSESIADVFSISNLAAHYALQSFYRWLAYYQLPGKSLNSVELQLHQQFYPRESSPIFLDSDFQFPT